MNSLTFKEFFGNRYYLFFSFVLAIPIWMVTNTYANSISVQEDEAVATGITISFFACVFSGRYATQIWSIKGKNPPRLLISGLCLLILACIGWLFFHADFPLKGRAALNLLFYWIPFLIVSLAIGILIKLIRLSAQRQLTEARSSAAQSKGELQLLQSQLSPHFLFNTLNNLYGLSLTQHQKIPALLLRLSDLLRYSVYEAGERFVPLKNELEYINNYIEFEKIRLGERLVLTSEIKLPESAEIKIAPMLLIVFIENAFKHSKNSTADKVYIDIAIGTQGNLIFFGIKNSREKTNSKALAGEHSGMGLMNVYKRLELLYHNEHILDIQDKEDSYSVTLQLKAKK